MTAQPGSRRGAPRPDSVVEGEYAFTDGDFRQIAAILYADSGISLPDTKATLVYSRLAKRLRALGLESFRDYCRLVTEAEGQGERKNMLAALTTNVTRFMREPHHFEHLATKVLPELVTHARAGGRVRIWSAACSTGQEPYSIALTILGQMPDAGQHDLRILATDIDPNVVETAKRGLYPQSEMSALPPAQVKRWMQNVGGGLWSVGDEMRDLVSFRELNLIGDWPMRYPFQAIFCRNVVIYFDEPTQTKVWGRFRERLAPGGRLYVGHSERVADPAFETDGLTTYRLKDRAR